MEPTSLNAKQTAGLSSAAYLQHQQAEAQAAIQATLRDVKRDVLNALDPEKWVRLSPWGTIGVAVVSGFAAASAVVPSRHPATATVAPAAAPLVAPTSPASTAFWGALSTGLYGLARVALTEVLNSAMRMESVRPPEEADAEIDAPAV